MKKFLIGFILMLSFGTAQAMVIGDPVPPTEPYVASGGIDANGRETMKVAPVSGIGSVVFFFHVPSIFPGINMPFPSVEVKISSYGTNGRFPVLATNEVALTSGVQRTDCISFEFELYDTAETPNRIPNTYYTPIRPVERHPILPFRYVWRNCKAYIAGDYAQ